MTNDILLDETPPEDITMEVEYSNDCFPITPSAPDKITVSFCNLADGNGDFDWDMYTDGRGIDIVQMYLLAYPDDM